MHLRGKDMTFSVIAEWPSETVLNAKFNFNWQLGYEMDEPIRVRKGTRMVVVAHHDNSANNPYNPDPAAEVAWGDLTSQEMVLPWFGVIVDRDADPEKILSIQQGGCGSGVLPVPIAPVRVPGISVPSTSPSLPLPTLPITQRGNSGLNSGSSDQLSAISYQLSARTVSFSLTAES